MAELTERRVVEERAEKEEDRGSNSPLSVKSADIQVEVEEKVDQSDDSLLTPHYYPVQEEVTWTCQFSDPQLCEDYIRFKITSTTYLYTVVTAVIFSLYFVFYWYQVLSHYADTFAIVLSVITLCFAIIPIWSVCFLRSKYSSLQIESEETVNSNSRKWLTCLESITIMGFILTFALIHIMRVNNGVCTEEGIANIWHCLPYYSCHSIFSESIQLLMMLPLIFAIILPYASFVLIIISFTVAVLLICITAGVENATMSIAWILSTIIFFVIILYFYQRQHIQLFLFTKRYKHVVDTREHDRRVKSKKIAEEMRNMVASISHDLKSPLAAIVCGIEMMRESVTQARLQHNRLLGINNSKPLKEVEDHPEVTSQEAQAPQDTNLLSTIEQSLQGMESSYYFMLMTINRSTHYTKTLYNVPLVPSFESINIKPIVKKAIGIVSNMQIDTNTEVKCHFQDSNDINMIVDKQWLLDNLLCLVSNAVKYSKSNSCCHVVVRKLTSKTTPFAHLEHLHYAGNHTSHLPKDWISFEVYDEGPGLTGNEAKTLFNEPDFSEQRRVGGAGLGLYCIGKRVSILQGCYGVRRKQITDTIAGSNLETGLVFWFALPLTTSSSTSHQKKAILRTSHALQMIRDEDISKAALELIPTKRKNSKVDSEDYFSPSRQTTSNSKEEVPTVSTKNMQDSDTNQNAKDMLSQNMFCTVQSQLRILVVDDALPILKMLRLMLENSGHHVVSAINGKEAVDILYPPESSNTQCSISTFDVILMDLQMPIMDGFEAMRTVRKKEVVTGSIDGFPSSPHETNLCPSSHICIIAMSANSDHDSIEQAYLSGADHFISKPFKMDKFNDAVQACSVHCNCQEETKW